MNIVEESEERRKNQHIHESKEFAEKFLLATGIKDHTFIEGSDHYLPENRDGDAVHQLSYALPNLDGLPRRDITLMYNPLAPDNTYTLIWYRNTIKTQTPNLLEFLGSSKVLRDIISIIGNRLEKIFFTIPYPIYHRDSSLTARKLEIIDQTAEDDKDQSYCTILSLLATPKIWEMQAQAIGEIERDIRQIPNGQMINERTKIHSVKIFQVSKS